MLHTKSLPTDSQHDARFPQVLVWLPVLVVVGQLALYAVYLNGYLWSAGEDGPYEWATVLAYVAATGFALVLAARWARSRMRLATVAYLVLAAGFVFIAGEEISWGQRVLGFDGPDALVERNLQGEANLHNLLGRLALEGMYILVGLWGVGAGRAIARRVSWLRPTFLYAPPRELMWWFLPALVYYVYVDYLGPAIRLLFPAFGDLAEGPPRFQEPVEFLLSVGFLLFVVAVWRRSTAPVPADETTTLRR